MDAFALGGLARFGGAGGRDATGAKRPDETDYSS